MKTDTIRTQRKFRDIWDESGYLLLKILYWFYDRGDRRKALPFAARLQAILERTPGVHAVTLGEECWSLVCEVQGDLAEAIAHREREVALIKRLHRIAAKSEHRHSIFRCYDYGDLSDRYDLLAILYHDAGDLRKAIKILKQSRRLCQRRGVRFDGADLLRDYLAEAAVNGQSPR